MARDKTARHTVLVVFGREACQACANGVRDEEKLGELGHLALYSFATEAELDAFILGLHEAEGCDLLMTLDGGDAELT